MSEKDIAKDAARKIMNDLSDRSGVLDGVDRATKAEILEEIQEHVRWAIEQAKAVK